MSFKTMFKKYFVKGLVCCVIGAMSGFAIIAVIYFADGPVQANIMSSVVPTPKSADLAAETKPGHLQGLKISFDYPGKIENVSRLNTDTNSLEQYILSSGQAMTVQISVTVRGKLPGGFLEESSYRVRATQPDQYVITDRSKNNYKISLARKSDKTEETLFIESASNVASISVTSTDTKLSASEVMSLIEPTVRLPL